MPSSTIPQYQNPVVRQRADPWIYRHTDGYYYFTASVPQYDGIELRRAKQINALSAAQPVTIWKKHPEGEMSCLIWAPELHMINGKWVIYFAAGHTMEVLDHRIYVLECEGEDPLAGPWVEKGKLDTGWDTFALDATSFLLNGKQYLVWAQQDTAIPGHSNLYIAQMKNPWTLESKATRLSYPEYDWECVGFLVNEGPAVLQKNGKLFLTYSASATDASYCMGVLWMDDTKDPLDSANWQKSKQPVFCTCAENGQYGPGHNSFTIAEDGKTDLLVYHARNYPEITGDPLYDPNRHTRVQAIEWDAQGMPIFGVPVPDQNKTL